MFNWFVIALIPLVSSMTAIESDKELRSAFHARELDEDRLEELYKAIDPSQGVLHKGYAGLVRSMQAEYQLWPGTKYSYFNEGKKQVEEAIASSPANPELRYLRLMIQLYAPSFLGYNDEINADLKVLEKQLPSYGIQREWKVKFVQILLNSGKLDPKQYERMERLKQNIAG